MFAFCQFQTSRSFYCSPRPSVEMAGASRMSRAGATRWLALALALSCVARGAHAGTPKPEPIVAKEFSFSDELDDAFVVALGSESAAVPLSPADLAALSGDDPSAVMMTAHDGRRYFCALPKPRGTGASDDETGGTGGRDATNASATDGDAEATVEDVLKPLEGRCFYRIEGWWTYEFCHMKKIRQYHQEDKKVTNEYNLGVYHPGLTKEAEKDRAAVDRSRTAGGDVVGTASGEPYHAHVFTEGTPCDLTTLKRRTEVRFTCAPNGVNVIASIEEPSTCSYVFVVRTPELCKRSEFRARVKETSHVRCRAVPAEEETESAGGVGVVRGESFAVPPKKTEL